MRYASRRGKRRLASASAAMVCLLVGKVAECIDPVVVASSVSCDGLSTFLRAVTTSSECVRRSDFFLDVVVHAKWRAQVNSKIGIE